MLLFYLCTSIMWHKCILFKATSIVLLKVACVSKFLTFDYLEYFKRKKITFENIDTNPELGRSLLLAVSSDWLPGLHASQHALIFTHFVSHFIIASCPLFSLLLRAIMDHAACPTSVWAYSKWKKHVSLQVACWFCSWTHIGTDNSRNYRESGCGDT